MRLRGLNAIYRESFCLVFITKSVKQIGRYEPLMASLVRADPESTLFIWMEIPRKKNADDIEHKKTLRYNNDVNCMGTTDFIKLFKHNWLVINSS